MGYYKPFQILRESDFYSSGGSVFHTCPPTNLTVSIPMPVVLAFGSCSLSEHLSL